MTLKTSCYDSDLSLQFGGNGREEGTTTWTGLTWVHRAAKGTKCEANQSRSCRAPCKPFTPCSSCAAQPLCPSPALTLPRHAGQDPALSSTPQHTLKIREPAHNNRAGEVMKGLNISGVTNTFFELRQSDTVEPLPTRGIEVNATLVPSALKMHTCSLKVPLDTRNI